MVIGHCLTLANALFTSFLVLTQKLQALKKRRNKWDKIGT